MFLFYSRKFAKKYKNQINDYINKNFQPPKCEDVRYSISVGFENKCDDSPKEPNIKNSVSRPYITEDNYNSNKISLIMHSSGSQDDKLFEMHKNINQSCVEKLIQLIDERGLKDSQVYKAAHIDKRLFSKIMSNMEYKPSKDTLISISFALKLSIDEASDLLERAGYTLSHSNKRDVMLEFFFKEKIYNIIDINGILYNFGQKTLGRM